MPLFVRLDVSLRTTSICVVEADGSVVWEGKPESKPAPLLKTISRWRKKIRLVGIEACPLLKWLYGALIESGLATICIEVRHAHRFLSTRPNKTDRNDAHGIADMMRLGHYRAVHVKSKPSLRLRTTVIARKKFVDHMLAIELTIRGLLKVHGLKVGAVHRCTFAARIETLFADAPELKIAIEPLLEARNLMRKQKAIIDRRLSQMARQDDVCRRLMSIPGAQATATVEGVLCPLRGRPRERPSPGWAETRDAAPSRGQLCRAIGRDPSEGEGAADNKISPLRIQI